MNTTGVHPNIFAMCTINFFKIFCQWFLVRPSNSFFPRLLQKFYQVFLPESFLRSLLEDFIISPCISLIFPPSFSRFFQQALAEFVAKFQQDSSYGYFSENLFLDILKVIPDGIPRKTPENFSKNFGIETISRMDSEWSNPGKISKIYYQKDHCKKNHVNNYY